MPEFNEKDTRLLLACSPDKKVSDLSKNTAVIKSLTEVFKATLEFADEEVLRSKRDFALALSKKALSVSNLAGEASGSKGLSSINFVASQTLTTIGLTKLAGMTPAKASIYLTVAAANKIVSAAGFAEFDKCKVAVGSLAATAGEGTLTCFATGAFSLGVGCVAGIVAVAANAFETYEQCYADQADKKPR